MCGHAVIALGRWAVDPGIVAAKRPRRWSRSQCPCGLVPARVAVRDGGEVAFRSVRPSPSRWMPAIDPGLGPGHSSMSASAAPSMPCCPAPLRPRRASAADARSGRRGDGRDRRGQAADPLEHPDDPDLAFLYGTILTDGGERLAGAPAPMSASSPTARSTAARPAPA